MGGFSNDGNDSVMFADNVDFSGGFPVANKVTTNGQLLIGATATPHIRVGNLTSTNGSVTITNGAGTIDLAVAASDDAVLTLTPDVGGAISPTAGNINVLGYDTSGSVSVMDTHNVGSSTMRVENRTWPTQFVVDSSTTVGDRGTFSTITAAMAAASSGDTIFIRPGTYTENFTITPGVNLTAFECDFRDTVTIVGKITMTGAGISCISGIKLQTNSDFFLVVSGNSASNIFLLNCYLNCANNTGISMTSSSSGAGIFINNCNGNLATTGIGYWSSSSAGTINVYGGTALNNTGGSTTATTASAGQVSLRLSTFDAPLSTSGTADLQIELCDISCNVINATAITCGGTGANSFVYLSNVSGGTATAISISASCTFIVSQCFVRSSNTNAISGAGTLLYGNNSFPSSSLINTTTQTPLVSTNTAVQVKAPGAYPYTTVPQDNVILVDTASARTINLNASPVTGQYYRIKDNVGSANTNNITISPAAGNIDGSGSYTINLSYGSVDLVYNGTQWNVL